MNYYKKMDLCTPGKLLFFIRNLKIYAFMLIIYTEKLKFSIFL